MTDDPVFRDAIRNAQEGRPLGAAPDDRVAPVEPLAAERGTLTIDQAETIAKALYEPTVRRIEILVQALISATSTADFALWAPLGAIDTCLRNLKWEDAGHDSSLRLVALVSMTLARYSDRLAQHLQAMQRAHEAGEPYPALPEWTQADTLTAYDTLIELFPLKETTHGPEAAPAAPAADDAAVAETPGVRPPGRAQTDH